MNWKIMFLFLVVFFAATITITYVAVNVNIYAPSIISGMNSLVCSIGTLEDAEPDGGGGRGPGVPC